MLVIYLKGFIENSNANMQNIYNCEISIEEENNSKKHFILLGLHKKPCEVPTTNSEIPVTQIRIMGIIHDQLTADLVRT